MSLPPLPHRCKFPCTAFNRADAWPHNVALWSSFMDASCVKGLSATPWACMLSNYSFPFIEVESYAVEAQTDQVVLTSHDDIPQQWVTLPPEQDYLGQWRDNMTIVSIQSYSCARERAASVWFTLVRRAHGMLQRACT